MTTPYRDEDAEIMRVRHGLENRYSYHMTVGEKFEWDEFLAIHVPVDVCLREYVQTPPTSMNQTLVKPRTQYAWSQIYAVLNFGFSGLQNPVEPTTRIASISKVKWDAARLLIWPVITPWPSGTVSIMTYCTRRGAGTYWAKRSELRLTAVNSTTTVRPVFDARVPYDWRFPYTPDSTVGVTFGYLDECHMFKPCGQVIYPN